MGNYGKHFYNNLCKHLDDILFVENPESFMLSVHIFLLTVK